MSRGGQLKVSRTKNIPRPNAYILALYEEFGPWCLDEEIAPSKKGIWRSEVFALPDKTPLDFEIGTGNGYHFANHAQKNPDRALLGIELKYKPLIQSIRRALKAGCQNARMCRYNAALIDEMFAPGELNNVFIHFPDPWSRLRQHKHRLIQDRFLENLFACQRPGSIVEFKTDNADYFRWALEKIERSPYTLEALSFDLHKSEFQKTNFITQFESIFMRKGLAINYALLRKP